MVEEALFSDLNPDGHILGIDADVHRVAWAYVYVGKVQAVGEIKRANQAGRIAEDYDAKLTGLMTSCNHTGAHIRIEGIYLPEKRQGEASRRNVLGFQKMAEVQGEIKHAARLQSVPVDSVLPATWMRDLLGRKRGEGNTKQMSMAWARRYWEKIMSEHEADAICIALWAWERQKDEENLLIKLM